MVLEQIKTTLVSALDVNLEKEEPLWYRLMTGPNVVALSAYFLLLGLGFALLKHLSDDEGSKLLQ